MNLSLCCQSNMLHEQNIRFRMMTVTQFKRKPRAEALQTLCERIISNFVTLKLTVQHCVSLQLQGLRIGSDLIPVINHPDLNIRFEDLPLHADIMHAVQEARAVMSSSGLRFSAHPSEFISLTSTNPAVVANSIRDLEAHALVFELLGLPASHEAPLNIHIRKDGDPEVIYAQVMHSLHMCPDAVRNRLVFENNDNTQGVWSIKNLVHYFYNRAGIPITYDTLHHARLSHDWTAQQAFDAAYDTWPQHIMPIFHYSEGIGDTRKHADYAAHLPPDHGRPVMWEVELKAKDHAIVRMQQCWKDAVK